MTRNEVNKAYLKLRDFLSKNGYSEGVGFDLRSYDDSNDIPHITHNGERRNVSFFQARGKETIAVVLTPYWHEVLININDMNIDELYELMNNVFMEMEESQDYIDFDDFLGL